MMKVVKNTDGHWSIYDGKEEVATIESEWRFNKADNKVLFVGAQRIGVVANQKEAITKVREVLGR